MAIEYKLSYTAKEVDEKLGKIETHSEKLLELEEEIDDLSTVATSGSYNDLINKPTIPTSLPASGGNADTVDNKHASDFEVAGAANTALTNAKAYINQEISALINGDKYTGALDTIKEISEAITENADTIEVLNTAITSKVDKVSGKGLSTNDYTTTEKNKLAGIASGANAYTHPTTAGNKHIPSGGSSGQILRWGADGTAVWGSDNNTTYNAATQSANGLMTATDKKKLDGIASGANAYSHPTTSGNKHIPSGGSSGKILRWSADGTAVWGVDMSNSPIFDTRDTNATPEWYMTNYPKQVVRDFKSTASIGLSGETYCCLETIVPWTDSSGGYPRQVASVNNWKYVRVGISNTQWSAWKKVASFDLLWENASPTSDFAAQTLNIGSGYSVLMFVYGKYANEDHITQIVFKDCISEGSGFRFWATDWSVDYGFYHRWRDVWLYSTSIKFGNGYHRFHNSSTNQLQNVSVSPIRIYGFA